MKKKLNIVFVIFIWFLALISVCTVVLISVFFWSLKPVSDEATSVSYELHVPKGMSVMSVSSELERNGIIKSRYLLYGVARYNFFDKETPFTLKSGVYNLTSAMSLEDIYNVLQTGVPENIKVSIPEGLTLSKVAGLLADVGLCDKNEFIKLCKDDTLLKEYGITSSSLEGYLFPDTYFFTEGMSCREIAKVLVDNFFVKIDTIDAFKIMHDEGRMEEFNKKLVLASIIEREYRVAEEAPIIASVFQNRLNNNIGLYSCATIEYILTEIEGRSHPDRITYDDLKIDSPYNTYKWAALPPTPISCPGLVALNAAANPAETDYYYFVLTNPQVGSHTFSKSFNQHIKAENLYTKPEKK